MFGDIESIKCDSECSSDSTNDFCGRLNNVLSRWISNLDIIRCLWKYMVEWCNNTVDHGNPKWKLYGEQYKWDMFGNVKSAYSNCESDAINCCEY